MITLTHNVKPSRKEAFALVCKAKSHHLTDSEIDSLINYFAPSVPTTPKTAFQWVARAASEGKDIRTYLWFVYVENGVMAATDGNRLHWANTDLADGYYDPKTGLKVKNPNMGKFPEWRRVVPNREAMFQCPEEKTLVQLGGEWAYDIGDLRFDKKYFDQALPYISATYIDHEKICGANQFGEFLIMWVRKE